MTRSTSSIAMLLLAASIAACGRPLLTSDAGMDGGPTRGPTGAGGAPAGGSTGTAGAAAGGAGSGEAGTSGGGSGGDSFAGVGGTGGAGGGAGANGRCRCSDGRCCGAGQLCEIETGACLTDGLPDGTCTARPVACDDLYQPVCGCDDMTYSNDCYRQLAGVPRKADGICVGVCPQLIPAGACTTPGKVCRYGLNSDPSCTGQVTCDPTTGQWSAFTGLVCP